MLTAFPKKGNSIRLFWRRIALWLTLIAVGQSGIGFALSPYCSRSGAGSSCCVSPSAKHSPARMRSMDCHDSANDETAEVSSAPCNMASSAVSLEFGEEGRLAAARYSALDSGLSLASWMNEGAFTAKILWRESIPSATRQRLPVDRPVPLRI